VGFLLPPRIFGPSWAISLSVPLTREGFVKRRSKKKEVSENEDDEKRDLG